MSNTYQALNIPPAANVAYADAISSGEGLAVFNEPNDWGRLFAEVARQVAHAYAHQDRFPQAETLARISSAFEAEMTSPPEVTSSVGPIGHG